MLEKSIIIRAIHEACRGLPIILAYLHGSYANGTADNESDLDVAILTEVSLSLEKRHDIRITVLQQLTERFGATCPSLDVIILQDAPVLLQYNVIRRGFPVVERSREDRAEYILSVEQGYDDEEPYIERETQIILDRILSHAAA